TDNDRPRNIAVVAIDVRAEIHCNEIAMFQFLFARLAVRPRAAKPAYYDGREGNLVSLSANEELDIQCYVIFVDAWLHHSQDMCIASVRHAASLFDFLDLIVAFY